MNHFSQLIKNEILGEKGIFNKKTTFFKFVSLPNFSLDTNISHIMGHFDTNCSMKPPIITLVNVYVDLLVFMRIAGTS